MGYEKLLFHERYVDVILISLDFTEFKNNRCKLHLFLNSVLDGGARLIARTGRLILWAEPPVLTE